MNNKRPQLNTISLKEAVNNMLSCKPGFFVTMSERQWDVFLDEAYFHQNATLIELDENEQPIAAYKKL